MKTSNGYEQHQQDHQKTSKKINLTREKNTRVSRTRTCEEYTAQSFGSQLSDGHYNLTLGQIYRSIAKLRFQNCQVIFCTRSQLTVNSRLADTSLLRTAVKSPETLERNKLPLLRTRLSTDLRTLYSVPKSQFYCFLSRYSGYRAASWNICTHIKSIFSAFRDCVSLFLSISASSVHQSKFLHLLLVGSSLQSRCHE